MVSPALSFKLLEYVQASMYVYVHKHIKCCGSIHTHVYVLLRARCSCLHVCVYASVLLYAYRTKFSCLHVSAFVHVCPCGLATLLPVQ